VDLDKANEQDPTGYWKATIRLTFSLLVVWFLVSYGAGILFREALDVRRHMKWPIICATSYDDGHIAKILIFNLL